MEFVQVAVSGLSIRIANLIWMRSTNYEIEVCQDRKEKVPQPVSVSLGKKNSHENYIFSSLFTITFMFKTGIKIYWYKIRQFTVVIANDTMVQVICMDCYLKSTWITHTHVSPNSSGSYLALLG